jgi:hypothetical protein
MRKIISFILIMVSLTFACQHDPLDVNVSGIQVDLVLNRFENDLFLADPSALDDSLPGWKKKYGTFLQHFSYIVKLGNTEDPGYAEKLRQFVSDHNNYLIYKRTREVFPDLDTISTALTVAFAHYRYYFPDKSIPRIVTYVSGFNQSAITDDSLLAIGLDKYLGMNETLYRQIGIYNYLLLTMHPNKLASDCMLFWGETEFPFRDSLNNLLVNMVYRGRLLYFADAMIPAGPDSLNWGFTAKNLDFCISNEKSMWTSLIENKYLFSTDRFTIDKFILEGPFTKDFGHDSPARAAVWIGYRIVCAYMANNPGVTLPELMEEKDYMKILNLSAYNP